MPEVRCAEEVQSARFHNSGDLSKMLSTVHNMLKHIITHAYVEGAPRKREFFPVEGHGIRKRAIREYGFVNINASQPAKGAETIRCRIAWSGANLENLRVWWKTGPDHLMEAYSSANIAGSRKVVTLEKGGCSHGNRLNMVTSRYKPSPLGRRKCWHSAPK